MDITKNLDLNAPKKEVKISINESLWKETKKKAWTNGQSFSELIEGLLRDFVIEKVRFGDTEINEYTDEELEKSD